MPLAETDFASSNNIGAVSAKEEVWEVTAQVAGYTASLAVLHALDTLLIPLTSDGEGRVADGALLLGVLWASCQGLVSGTLLRHHVHKEIQEEPMFAGQGRQ